jgi:beta-glucanase (GH16 family)
LAVAVPEQEERGAGTPAYANNMLRHAVVGTVLLAGGYARADELRPDKPKSFCDAAGWSMVFSDDFSGSALNTSSWTVDLGAGDSRVRNSQGTADNVYLENGALVLRSKREKAGKWNYTSGAVQTMGKASWKHAGGTRACVLAKLPGGQGEVPLSQGVWPAHWMMPDNKACWPSNGEIVRAHTALRCVTASRPRPPGL